MGVEYILVNETKKEMISFSHLNGSKMRELAGNSAQSAIVTWYLLKNQGDQIQFVSDTYDDWPFETGDRNTAFTYPDKTEELVLLLIEQEILKDEGMLHVDNEEPETIYTRNIVNAWQV
ncbi:hypothetical protein [Spartinivicinus ruber]|uniref:hypothetical protein n=1 Tax=Spartinivicinus ruber TaxID=2683272 RepID=UPI0013D3AB22|nr:hypothetical protein [Spartinivicinus ruber]